MTDTPAPDEIFFYRLERDNTGPINHPLSDYTGPLYAMNERRIDRQRTRPKHPTLDEIVDHPCTHWRSGTLNEGTLRDFFDPDLPELLAAGFELRRYTLPQEEVLSSGDHAAAKQEVLDHAEYRVLAGSGTHRDG